MPTALTVLIDDQLLALTPGLDTFMPSMVTKPLFSSPAVRQKLIIHETKLKRLFRKWALEDGTKQTILISEVVEMFDVSRICDKRTMDLGSEQVTQACVLAMLGDHDGAYEQWLGAGDNRCKELIFAEFVDAVMRASLLKFESDSTTPVDLKVHEMCLLLTFGPAGLEQTK